MSGFYIGVDGKARKVKGGYIGVDGKARKIKKGYIGDENGVARLCWSAIDPVFANNTWEDVIAACQTNSVPDTWSVGDQKTMTINGTDYVIDIIGKNHDDYSDGSGKAPLTFQLHDCYSTTYKINSDSTSSEWKTCDMRVEHLSKIKSKMPIVIQNAIQKVNKLSITETSTAIVQNDLFLLSETELSGKVNHTYDNEGSQYEYYSKGNAITKKLNTNKQTWWLRSVYSENNSLFVDVTAGGVVSYANVTNAYGVSFAFCF